jgi:predicted nucleotidyltransferase
MLEAADPTLSLITAALKAEYKPLRLILYGSRAQGTHRPDSDYDFVMVLPKFDRKDRYELMSRISSKLLAELNAEVQVWTYSEEDFNDWKDEFSSIPETAANTGKEIELG